MKKTLLSIIMLVALFIPNLVSALEATCIYNYNEKSVTGEDVTRATLNVKYITGKELEFDISTLNSNYEVKNMAEDIKINLNDIVDENGVVSCPKLKVTKTSQVTGRNQYYLKFETSDDGTVSGNLICSEYVDSVCKETISIDQTVNKCIYIKGTNEEFNLYWYGNEAVIELIGDEFKGFCKSSISGFTADDFKNDSCPAVYKQKVYKYQGTGNCEGRLIISKTPTSSGAIPLYADGKENIYTGEDVPKDETNDTNLEEYKNCTSILGSPNKEKSPAWYLSFVFGVMKYVAIMLLIVMSIIDFASAIASQDNDILKKTVNKTITRAIICVIIFLLPTLIDFVLQFVHESAISECINKGV